MQKNYKDNGHTNEQNKILKIDIEKLELESLIDLNENIAIEYHHVDEKRI